MKAHKSVLSVAAAVLASAAFAQSGSPNLGPNYNGARYATDAYPGFDVEEEMVKPERREPRWFSWITGPKRETASAQFAYCQELVAEGDFSKAAKQLDALVREWPTAPEAWQAQQQLADIQFEKLKDFEDAFKSYRYLLDFYSLQCDYKATADKLYKAAGAMEIEGKAIMFVRFENTVDVRRAYETCVLRAPGASWVPAAMLTIARLRERDGQQEEAVKVYENLRNLHPDSDESKTALAREAGARVDILRRCEYNRSRTRDTADFLKMALRGCRPSDAEAIQKSLSDVQALLSEEAYLSARFYDSPTRTKRSAVAAYEKFLAENPGSARAEEVRARLEMLKGAQK